jgi:hypothetical protein
MTLTPTMKLASLNRLIKNEDPVILYKNCFAILQQEIINQSMPYQLRDNGITT